MQIVGKQHLLVNLHSYSQIVKEKLTFFSSWDRLSPKSLCCQLPCPIRVGQVVVVGWVLTFPVAFQCCPQCPKHYPLLTWSTSWTSICILNLKSSCYYCTTIVRGKALSPKPEPTTTPQSVGWLIGAVQMTCCIPETHTRGFKGPAFPAI